MDLCCCPPRAPPLSAVYRPPPPPLPPLVDLRRPSPARFRPGICGGGGGGGLGLASPAAKRGRVLSSYYDEISTAERIEKVSEAAVEPETAEEVRVEDSEVDPAPVGVADVLFGDLDLKLNPEDSLNIFLYATGALVALLVVSGIVSAVDSVPVFPKVLEVVGLGFTIWFSARYLIFKSNRDELSALLESLKEQIIGPSDG